MQATVGVACPETGSAELFLTSVEWAGLSALVGILSPLPALIESLGQTNSTAPSLTLLSTPANSSRRKVAKTATPPAQFAIAAERTGLHKRRAFQASSPKLNWADLWIGLSLSGRRVLALIGLLNNLRSVRWEPGRNITHPWRRSPFRSGSSAHSGTAARR